MFTHSIRTYRLFISTIVIVSTLASCGVLEVDIEEPLASDTVAESPVSATDMPTQEAAPTPDVSTQELESVATTPESEASVPAENTGNVARVEQAALVANPGETESSTTFRTRLDEVTLVGTVTDAPSETELQVAWLALDPNGVVSDEITDEEFDVAGTQPFDATLARQLTPLPAGDYRVEVMLDGQVAEQIDFTLIDPVPSVLVRPERDLPDTPPPDLSAVEPTNLQFIVDGSGSMAELLDGMPKMIAAQDALQALVTALPETTDTLNVGVRAYGQQANADQARSCQDTELLVPMEGVVKEQLRQQINTLAATGEYTPMAYAVEQAAQDFTEDADQNVIVLVSDGKENCVDDPVERIQAAAESANLTIHVVGFDIGEDAEARNQLQSIADATGGLYVDAPNPEELTTALQTIVAEQIEIVQIRSGAGQLRVEAPPRGSFWRWVLTDADGQDVLNGDTGTYLLEAGMYTMVFEPNPLSEGGMFRVEIAAGQESVLRLGTLQLRFQGDYFRFVVRDQVTGRDVGQAFATYIEHFVDEPRAVPPGRYTLLMQSSLSSDLVVIAEDVLIEPGQVVEVTP